MKIPKLKVHDLILIHFLDLEEDPTWQSFDQARQRPDSEGLAVGFYFKHDEQILYTYTQCVGSGSDMKVNKLTYPIGCILKIRKIKLGKE